MSDVDQIMARLNLLGRVEVCWASPGKWYTLWTALEAKDGAFLSSIGSGHHDHPYAAIRALWENVEKMRPDQYLVRLRATGRDAFRWHADAGSWMPVNEEAERAKRLA